MLDKLSDFLSGWKMTFISTISIILSFILMRKGVAYYIYPAYLTVVISGIPIFYGAIWCLKNNKGIKKITSALLISIAMLAAIYIGEIFAAGEVAFIMAIGYLLEELTTSRAQRGLQRLISMTPISGRVILEGNENIVPADEIQKGDIVRVLPGEQIPIDGEIVKGESSLNQSIITGESIPVERGVGDRVYSGTINCFGVLEIKATEVGEDSSIQRLINMVKEAQEKQAPTQRIADQWASWLVPIALVTALLTWLFTGNIVRAVTILVVFCPCSLVLATPVAIMAGIGQATKHGVIIKSGAALENMSKVSLLTFDKTGTLTYGKLTVSDIISLSKEIDSNKILSLAASVEQNSEHPIGKAIVEHAKNNNIELFSPEQFHMDAGKGVYAEIEEQKINCGSEKYFQKTGLIIGQELTSTLESIRRNGKTSILVAAEDNIIGVIALSDKIRPNAKEMVTNLKKLGTDAMLLTGDNERTAFYFSRQSGIEEVEAELLPEDKVKIIEQMESEGKVVCMVGDGVNDAPALKVATVGIAMGEIGSDIAIDAADIAIINDDISKLPYLKRISTETVRTIITGITVSMALNFTGILLSIYGILNPTTGALMHNAGSIFVVSLAALLYDRKFE